MEMEKLSFPEAVQFLLQHKGSPKAAAALPPVDIEEIRAQNRVLLEMSYRSVAWRWLEDRGIEVSTVKNLCIGWTGREYVIPHFANASVQNVKYRVHPRYQRHNEPKYNSLPHRTFSFLYPWDYFRKTFSDAKTVFITEGEFDCAILLQCGLPSLSLPSGANTPWNRWVPFLKQFDTVYVIYDQDVTGRECANRLVTDKGKIGRSVADMLLPTKLHSIRWDETLYGKDVTDARKFLVPTLLQLYSEGKE